MVITNGVFSVANGGVNLATTSSDTIQFKIPAKTGASPLIGETDKKFFKFFINWFQFIISFIKILKIFTMLRYSIIFYVPPVRCIFSFSCYKMYEIKIRKMRTNVIFGS